MAPAPDRWIICWVKTGSVPAPAFEQLEQAGAEFKRAAGPLVARMEDIEAARWEESQRLELERARYLQTLEQESAPAPRSYYGPGMG